MTRRPTAANIRRTWRFHPVRSTSRTRPLPTTRRPNSSPTPSSSCTPRPSAESCALVGAGSTSTSYSRSCPKRGCRTRSAHAPSFVRSSRPSESESSRPTGYRRSRAPTSDTTVARPRSSRAVDTMPVGLFSSTYRWATAFAAADPSTSSGASGARRSPTFSGFPRLVTRPAAMSCSACRRDATPRSARILWTFAVPFRGGATAAGTAGRRVTTGRVGLRGAAGRTGDDRKVPVGRTNARTGSRDPAGRSRRWSGRSGARLGPRLGPRVRDDADPGAGDARRGRTGGRPLVGRTVLIRSAPRRHCGRRRARAPSATRQATTGRSTRGTPRSCRTRRGYRAPHAARALR